MITKHLDLNVWSKNSNVVWANTGETSSRFLEISLIDGEDPFDLTDKRVILYAEKPDKMIIFNNCQILDDPQDGKILVEITEQITAVQGIINCEFHVIKDDSVILKVVGLKIISNQCSFNGLEILSSSEYTTLLDAVQRAESAEQTVQQLVSTIDSRIDSRIAQKIEFEQGTWTPNFVKSQTSSTLPNFSTLIRDAFYYRIGRICFISFRYNVEVTNSGTSKIYIGGLPYAASSEHLTQSIAVGHSYGTFSENGGPLIISKSLPNILQLRQFHSSSTESFKVTESLDIMYSGSYLINSSYI